MTQRYIVMEHINIEGNTKFLLCAANNQQTCRFDVFARHREPSVLEVFCFRVCPSVSEFVCESVRPENLISQRSMKEILFEYGH